MLLRNITITSVSPNSVVYSLVNQLHYSNHFSKLVLSATNKYWSKNNVLKLFRQLPDQIIRASKEAPYDNKLAECLLCVAASMNVLHAKSYRSRAMPTWAHCRN